MVDVGGHRPEIDLFLRHLRREASRGGENIPSVTDDAPTPTRPTPLRGR